MGLTSLDLIQENKYCYIYRSECDGQPFIIKKYKGDDSSLIEEEAKALNFYHDIAKDDPDLIDSKAVKLIAEKNLLCIGFVEGECFSDVLYRGRKGYRRTRAIYPYHGDLRETDEGSLRDDPIPWRRDLPVYFRVR